MFLNKHNMGNFWNTTIWGIGAELLKNILEYGEFPKREISAVEYVRATIWGIPHIEARMRKSAHIVELDIQYTYLFFFFKVVDLRSLVSQVGF